MKEIASATICSPERMLELLEEGYVKIGERQALELKKRRVLHYNCQEETRPEVWVNVYLAKKEHLDYLDSVKSIDCANCPNKYWKSREGAENRLVELKVLYKDNFNDNLQVVKCRECSRYRMTTSPRPRYQPTVLLIVKSPLTGRKTMKAIEVSAYTNKIDAARKFIPLKFMIRENVGGCYVFRIPDYIWRVDYAKSEFLDGAEDLYVLKKEGKVIKGRLAL